MTTLGSNLAFAHFQVIPDDQQHFVVATGTVDLKGKGELAGDQGSNGRVTYSLLFFGLLIGGAFLLLLADLQTIPVTDVEG